MHAVILLAGYGGRLDRDDLPHKSLLPFGDQTLLSRHLSCLGELEPDRIHLVLGHNKNAVRDYVLKLGLNLPINFIENDLYRTTGNTLSMVMGLRQCEGDVVILDGDVLYPKAALYEFVRKGPPTSFALVPSDIDNDEESAKALLDAQGTIRALITKRALTGEEKTRFIVGGEAIGFIKLAAQDTEKFIALYDRNESEYREVLWEIPFTDFSGETEIRSWPITDGGCFEIDTQEDYLTALSTFEQNPGKY